MLISEIFLDFFSILVCEGVKNSASVDVFRLLRADF